MPFEASTESFVGPLLTSRGWVASGHRLSVLLGVAETPPVFRVGTKIIEPIFVDELPDVGGSVSFWRWDFVLPETGGVYELAGQAHRVPGCAGDVRLAYVSCNGKETGDFDRPAAKRDAMWQRLADSHTRAPFSLMLSGGDQIYADAGVASHPSIMAWLDAPKRQKSAFEATDEMETALLQFFLDRWRRTLAVDGAARLFAEVPGLAMWDDHDIIDGWGSHPAQVQESAVGQLVYRVAHRIFRLFQAGGQSIAPYGLGFARSFPGFSVIAPDLRSERTRDRVLSAASWDWFEQALRDAPEGMSIIMSSVPALGPRLSLLEGLHRLVPGMQKYEDDLRDQWQSRSHRAEWQRLLGALAHRALSRGPVVIVSGEIHLATRGELALPDGGVLHQLTSSGISHPPPPALFAKALGTLARLGDSPLANLPIALRPIPGQPHIYTAERNYLALERDQHGGWSATWDLEDSGQTPGLSLTASAM